ncbi:unnamed protein product, partial [Prunus brigantina]
PSPSLCARNPPVTVHRDGNRHPAATSGHLSPRDRSRSTRREVPIKTHLFSRSETSNIADDIDWFEPVSFRRCVAASAAHFRWHWYFG